jgi:ubiquinone/menaquinone biosynthesis C-methylase UbiE
VRNGQERAAAANSVSYASLSRDAYIRGAPHIRHSCLRALHDELTQKVLEEALKHSPAPRILDLGAGEGSLTATYLRRSAKVTAVDVSEARLRQLTELCQHLPGQLQTVCSEAFQAVDTLQREGKQYDVIVATAFLHHVPNYEDLLRRSVALLTEHGQVFTFEDPLRYDSLDWPSRIFSGMAYLSWRLWQGDLAAGAHRYIRRQFGHYTETPEDQTEYHIVRNGVDQDALERMLREENIDCHIVRYFSTQAPRWTSFGTHLRVVNSFGIIANRRC